jgi:hypothetical protein
MKLKLKNKTPIFIVGIISLIGVATLLRSFAAIPSVGAINNWVTTSGGTKISIDMTPLWGESGYHYYSMSSLFKGQSYGLYAGLQTNGNLGNGQDVGNIYVFSVWNAKTAKPDNGSTATPFGGEGVGYSLRMPYDWKVGTTYTISMLRERFDSTANAGTGGWIWSSNILDKSTGKVTRIGEITGTAQSINLQGSSAFHERFKGSSPVCTTGSSNLEKAGVRFDKLSSDVAITFSGTSAPNNIFAATECKPYIHVKNSSSSAITGFGVTQGEFDSLISGSSAPVSSPQVVRQPATTPKPQPPSQPASPTTQPANPTISEPTAQPTTSTDYYVTTTPNEGKVLSSSDQQKTKKRNFMLAVTILVMIMLAIGSFILWRSQKQRQQYM